jgi:hypothetical protein
MSFITPEDLVGFHVKHIGPVPTPKEEPTRSTPVERYPDGTVRTLTDEQIAFFRASELRQLQVSKKQHKNHFVYENQPPPSQRTSSVQETQPFTPINPDHTTYDTLYGDFKPYIQQLETKNDERFIEICRKSKVRNYYPILPINN